MYFSLQGLWGRNRLVHRQWKPLNEAVSVILAVLYDTPGAAVTALKRSPKALGYLCGLHDPVAAEHAPASAPRQRADVVRSSFSRMFGDYDGTSLAMAALACQDDAEFAVGFALGAADFEHFLVDRVTPMGLVRVLPAQQALAVVDAPRLLV